MSAKIVRLFKKLNLSGIEEWPLEEQESVKSLIKEFRLSFVLDYLDLGKTSIVKHSIKLTENMPFKERYRCFPHHQFDEVKKHLQEMLEIGAIPK